MAVDTAFGNSVPLLQKANQFHKRPHLLRGRYCVIKVAYQTNSHRFFISPVSRGPPQ